MGLSIVAIADCDSGMAPARWEVTIYVLLTDALSCSAGTEQQQGCRTLMIIVPDGQIGGFSHCAVIKYLAKESPN